MRYRPLFISSLIAFNAYSQTPVTPGELVAPGIESLNQELRFGIQHSIPGRRYQLQRSATLAGGDWQDVGSFVDGNGAPLVISTPFQPEVKRQFYRLSLGQAYIPPPEGFVLIPAGAFQMGDHSDPPVGSSVISETPVRSVHVSAFYIASHEMTKPTWDVVRTWGLANGYTDLPAGREKTSNHPLFDISWNAAVKWCNARSEKEGLTPCYKVPVSLLPLRTGSTAPICDWSASGYRLPTEAEWEKSARGGTSGQHYFWGDLITHSRANYYSTTQFDFDVSPSRGYHPIYGYLDFNNPKTAPVGSFPPNSYGLYDTAGNLWEWCWDWAADVTNTGAQSDPKGPSTGSLRVLKGGSWTQHGASCRPAAREDFYPGSAGSDITFRLVRRATR